MADPRPDDALRLAEEMELLEPSELARELSALGERPVDLRAEEDLRLAQALAGLLAERFPDEAELAPLERELIAERAHPAILPGLAVKLARSQRIVRALDGPAFVSVVFAVYKEHQRVLTPREHPHGEDFLVRKVAQLDWLLGERADLDYEVIAVDDGCPEGSGHIVRRIAEERGLADRVRVLFLEEAIRAGLPVTRPLRSADESRKGGSIEYGMWEAVQTERPGHAVVFTDADLSTHLGQVGLLLAPLRAGALAAVGSRREPTSVAVKGAERDDRGKLFIYLWKRLLAPLAHVTDTQCGFKAFDAGVVPRIVDGTLEKQFAFDIELMLRAELLRRRSVVKVPIAWIDSEAASTTADLQPYLEMLKAAAAMYRAYLPPAPAAEPFARFLEELDEERWQRLLTDVPAAITSRDPAEFDRFDAVGAEDLARRA